MRWTTRKKYSREEFSSQRLRRMFGKEEEQDPAMRNIQEGWKIRRKRWRGGKSEKVSKS